LRERAVKRYAARVIEPGRTDVAQQLENSALRALGLFAGAEETWALIVWLNYAAWLHMRLMKGLRGNMSAWWALVGLAVTTFAFLGVNMFLSGLHSYGEL
jgi:Cytochrome C assembly protein